MFCMLRLFVLVMPMFVGGRSLKCSLTKLQGLPLPTIVEMNYWNLPGYFSLEVELHPSNASLKKKDGAAIHAKHKQDSQKRAALLERSSFV
jgi:hypothetical protein